ncbi:MAG: hypothetical protein NZ695_02020 [Dehalococcoidia bacterium]|nr:hypothetical protein [Dehalococcoidia bacterium]
MVANPVPYTAAEAGRRPAGRWKGLPFHLLAIAGSVAVVVGSYLPWATFYDGLYRPDGVSGHGRFFIGLAVAAVASAVLSEVPPRAPSLRWAVGLAGALVGAFAMRDLWNLKDMTGSPEAILLFMGEGPGLYVVVAGAGALLASLALSAQEGRPASLRDPSLLGRWGIVLGLALLVPGAYGDYFMHTAVEHAAHRDALLNLDHVLTFGGGLLLAAGGSAFLATKLTGR